MSAIDFWERALAAGHHIAAVGGSDSHHAGETPDQVTHSPIGTPTTMVRADELSEAGIKAGVEAGHTYVKLFGADGPDLRFEARAPGMRGPAAIMGDTVSGGTATFTAKVFGAGPDGADVYQLVVVKDGAPLFAVPITSDEFVYRFASVGEGRYRLQVQRGSAIEALTTPIWLAP